MPVKPVVVELHLQYKKMPMLLQQNFSLKDYNTFGIDVSAKYFTSFNNIDELNDILDFSKSRNENHLVIGGGSNILFTKNFDGVVAKNALVGIEIVNEDEQHFYVKANAGEAWHRLVLFCLDNNCNGIENLSLIPGCVGAAPMQNIGAYGVELKDIFFELEAYNIEEKAIKKFSLADCEFGYRESVFKRQLKNKYVIVNVTLKLNKKPSYNTKYGAIEQELEKMGCKELSAKNIAQAVINIRSSKLPNPLQIGNAGSFFKNPLVDVQVYTHLMQQYPDIPVYPAQNNKYKLAAGWLIEQCGYKGYRKNDAGCHAKQALVLVNYGRASGSEIFELSSEIIDAVKQKFGVDLEREVNII